MAGFLRRKTKQSQQQPDVPLKDVYFDDSPSTAPSTPLFARFATTANNNSNKDGITPRMVSGPMQLSSRKDRDPAASVHRSGGSGKGGSGYGHSTTSLTAGSRDAELAARSRRMQAHIQERGFGAGVGFDDKPLPPPVDKPSTTTTAYKLSNATRGPGPPPTLQNQYHQNQNGRSRLSLDGRELENKPLPLPHPGPSPYQHQGTTYPSEVSTRRRNGSLAANTNAAPPPTISPTASYGQGYGLRMPDDGNNIGNGIGILPANGANANRMSLAPAPRLEGLGTATPASDRAIDLPPEVALFQGFSDAISIPSAPNSLNSRQPKQNQNANPNSVEHIPRSSVYIENDLNSKPQPRPPYPAATGANPSHLPQPQPQQRESDKLRPPSPPLPPPPSHPSPLDSDMGTATSHMGPSDVLPPPAVMKDFYPPRSHHQFPSVPQQQQQQTYQGPARSNSRSTSPPLPPGAAQPMSFAALNGNGRQQQQQRVQQRPHNQTQPYPQPPPQPSAPHRHQHQNPQPHSPPQPPQPFQPLQPRPQSQYRPQPPLPQSSQPQSQPVPTPGGAELRKTPSMQQPSAAPVGSPLMRGKPKIFAAMEAQDEMESGGDGGHGYGNEQAGEGRVQASPYQRQSQYGGVPGQPSYQTQPQAHHVALPQSRPSLNQQSQSHTSPQQQPPQPLLPPVEFFTPKSRVEPLPNEFLPEIPNEADTSSLTSQPRPQPPSPPRLAAIGQDQQLVDAALRTPRSTAPRSLPRQDSSSSGETPQPPTPQQQSQQVHSTPAAPRARKLSKARNPVDMSTHHPNGSSVTLQSSAESHSQQHRVHRSISKPLPSPISPPPFPAPQPEPVVQLDEETIRNAGIPLDDDPFARVEGVRVLKPTTPPPPGPLSKGEGGGSGKRHKAKGSLKGPSTSVDSVSGAEDSATSDVTEKDDVMTLNGSQAQAQDDSQLAKHQVENGAPTPLTPALPEDYRQSRKDKKRSKSKTKGPRPAPPTTVQDAIAQVQAQAQPPYTLMQFLSDPHFLSIFLSFLSFYDWCVLSAISKDIRTMLVRTPELREVVLESYLKTIGYSRWIWDDQEPLSLSLQDLNDYMRGVTIPTHEYARVAAMYVHSLSIHPNHRDPSLGDTLQAMRASARAYTRVILRLRAQAEKEASLHSQVHSPQGPTPPPPPSKSGVFSSPARPGTASRVSSRAPSPTTSVYSHSHSAHGHVYGQTPGTPGSIQPTSSQTSFTFRSPLFRLRRAPLLRVFVPSPEGDWLSDKSVLECEAECKRAGVQHLMRLGDVVWDVAAGDEGNVGRLVWDGSYLIDLDYTYSSVGDLPKYLPTLAFPPSYFHRVIRTGANISNPIAHIDVSPWGEEIAMNLQLLQDRVRTETPQGAYHNVVRWVHRSSFTIRPSKGAQRYLHGTRGPSSTGRIPIPDSNNLFVDHGWYGIIVVETEGTNEALADLQDRCGPGAFPPRPRGMNGQTSQVQVDNRKVFRILRERSRPGEIWIKAVSVKERLL